MLAMSQHLISRYLNELSDLRRVSGEARESVVREAFKTLLKDWGRSKDLIFVPEYKLDTPTRDRRFVDGALLYELRVPYGFWEAKDDEDDLDAEIQKKFRRGYPQDNIVFEDSRKAVLIQNRQEIMRCSVDDPEQLEKLLDLFFSHERPEISEFRKAVEQFKADLPAVLAALRGMIERSETTSPEFHPAALHFLKHAQETINPNVSANDVREMLIQHILTEEIFAHVFDNADFHRQNNIARELYKLEETFFTGAVKHRTLEGLKSYYAAIRSTAALVSSHHEKQNFLKVVYENFYKVYNPKAADRLGVIYTPNEIVRFMVESTDWLCQRHFGRQLSDRNIEILDPAAGTGTFIAELVEHFRGQPAKLKYKYHEELHANEVAILPYYVANLNIEATYAALTGDYEEYPNLCFVDTLDNIAGLGVFAGHQHELFGGVSETNIERIRRQNKRKISVVIGNPPYNAWQENYNSRNPNRPYKRVDERIHDTYAKEGTAQNQNALYDMYTRFFRWASDRVCEDAIIAFIMNRNFIEKNAFDGFRKTVARDFEQIWLVDLGGDVRANPKISGTRHNVFGIQTGVTIAFFIKRRGKGGAVIHYACRPEMELREDKLSFLATNNLPSIQFEILKADRKKNWLNLTNNDWESLLPLADKKANLGLGRAKTRLFSALSQTGCRQREMSGRTILIARASQAKFKWLIDQYEHARLNKTEDASNIKWDADLSRHRINGVIKTFDDNSIIEALYRPFIRCLVYFDRHFNSRVFQLPHMFYDGKKNTTISFSDPGFRADFCVLASDRIVDLHFGASVDAYQCVSRFRYGTDGSQTDNITDWALEQFQAYYHYGYRPRRPITKDAVFHYVHGVLYDPAYREKYALNLKREFPRIPLYADFWRWADWGERLVTLHIGYETIEPWPLARVDVPDEKSRRAGLRPKPFLRADKIAGNIMLDTETQLSGIPKAAWDYRPGNRSALEWILDQHRERKPRDPMIRERFNTYRFADHKEKVIELLTRVTRVSVETMAIVTAMKGATTSR
jgi:predicted helicase